MDEHPARGGLSAVNRRIQNYSPVVRRLRIAWKTRSVLGEGGGGGGGGGGFVDSQTSRSLDSFLSLADTGLRPFIRRLRIAWKT